MRLSSEIDEHRHTFDVALTNDLNVEQARQALSEYYLKPERYPFDIANADDYCRDYFFRGVTAARSYLVQADEYQRDILLDKASAPEFHRFEHAILDLNLEFIKDREERLKRLSEINASIWNNTVAIHSSRTPKLLLKNLEQAYREGVLEKCLENEYIQIKLKKYGEPAFYCLIQNEAFYSALIKYAQPKDHMAIATAHFLMGLYDRTLMAKQRQLLILLRAEHEQTTKQELRPEALLASREQSLQQFNLDINFDYYIASLGKGISPEEDKKVLIDFFELATHKNPQDFANLLAFELRLKILFCKNRNREMTDDKNRNREMTDEELQFYRNLIKLPWVVNLQGYSRVVLACQDYPALGLGLGSLTSRLTSYVPSKETVTTWMQNTANAYSFFRTHSYGESKQAVMDYVHAAVQRYSQPTEIQLKTVQAIIDHADNGVVETETETQELRLKSK